MKIISKQMPRDYNLYVGSDLHLGSPTVSEDAIAEMVNDCKKDRKGYMANIGDNIEAITAKDKRFEFSNTKYQTAHEQADAVVKLFKPLGQKLLAVGFGNHEMKLNGVIQADRYIAEALGVPHGRYEYKLQMYDKDTGLLMHKHHFWHGAGQVTSNAKDKIQAEGNMKAALKNKLMRKGWADCIAHYMGHIHRFIIVPPTVNNELYLTTDQSGKIKQHYRHHENQAADYISPDARWYVATGSFMKTYCQEDDEYISYAETFGYSPAEIGYLKTIVRDGNIVDIERVLL
jgi:hypothetical protein